MAYSHYSGLGRGIWLCKSVDNKACRMEELPELPKHQNRRILGDSRFCNYCGLGLSIMMSCRAWHSVAGSIVATPTRSPLLAWNSMGGFLTLAGMPVNRAMPCALV